MNATIVSKLQPSDAGGSGGMELVLQTADDLCYENAHKLLEAVTEMLSHGPQAIWVELSEKGMIDSSGIRALLQSRRMCVDSGARFAIGSMSSCAARVMRMSGFDRVFDLGDCVCQAPAAVLEPDITYTIAGAQSFESVAASEAAVVPVLRQRISRAAAQAGADADMLCDIKLAVGEALTNAYKHGSPRKGIDRITVRCTTAPGTVVIEIEDQGGIFDPDAVPIPDPTKVQPHGMGIYLMRQTMDAVQILSRESGTTVRMLKKWPIRDAEDDSDGVSAI